MPGFSCTFALFLTIRLTCFTSARFFYAGCFVLPRSLLLNVHFNELCSTILTCNKIPVDRRRKKKQHRTQNVELLSVPFLLCALYHSTVHFIFHLNMLYAICHREREKESRFFVVFNSCLVLLYIVVHPRGYSFSFAFCFRFWFAASAFLISNFKLQ